MVKRKVQRFFGWVQRLPGWLWRLAASTTLGGMAMSTVVQWAQVQRGYPSVGGEYILTLAVVVLPFAIFRR